MRGLLVFSLTLLVQISSEVHQFFWRRSVKRVETDIPVQAELDDALTLDDLLSAEELWAPARIRITRHLFDRSVAPAQWPESLHWNWAAKARQLRAYAPGPLSPYRLFGLRAEGEWQGALLASCVGHATRLPPGRQDLVYIDYVEVAPWNWALAEIEQAPRFKGIGMQLVELAVRWSVDLEFRGRLGLHSLPQSEGFYRGRCGMADLGRDAKHHDLRYFELDEARAMTFLGKG